MAGEKTVPFVSFVSSFSLAAQATVRVFPDRGLLPHRKAHGQESIGRGYRLFLTNESDKPARIGFSITANGVHYYLTMLKLAPHETRAIDIRQLRDAQVADFKKNLIPAAATDGAVTWVRIDNVPVMGRLMVIERHNGLAASYDCCACPCPDDFVGIGVSPSAIGVEVGWAYSCTATAEYDDCNANQSFYDETSNSSWSSTDTTIATVDGAGNVTGVSSGSVTIDAAYSDCQYMYDEYNCYCNQNPSSSSCAVSSYTAIQHTYPNNPFGSKGCWISQFFDHISPATGKPHRAEDTVESNGKGGGVDPSLGDPVYAAEVGTVVYPTSSSPVYGPASPGYPNCGSHDANYVKIKGTDNYYTVYIHVSPTVTSGQTVNAGDEIGTVDNSGCESGRHVHVQREDANLVHYNLSFRARTRYPLPTFGMGWSMTWLTMACRSCADLHT